MKISSEHIGALESLGYRPDEARFLYLVATFSGYFTPRQFIACTGRQRGGPWTSFTRKLESRGQVGWREYPQLDGVYHLWSKLLYRSIGKENLCRPRRHSPEFIRTRLVALDFILANPEYEYLETETDKVRYFREQLGLPEQMLPAKDLSGPSRGEPRVRYFFDQYPIYLAPAEGDARPRVTFTYIDPGHASLAGFRHHLENYQKLLSSLSSFGFIYLSDSPVHFRRAEERFRWFVERALQNQLTAALLSYFTLRAKWDQKRFAELSSDDVESLELASQRFQGAETERRYTAWCAGEGLRDERGGHRLTAGGGASRDVRFECRLLSRGHAVSKEAEVTQ